MASVYRRRGRRKYSITYTDENGARRTVTASPDKTVTRQIAAELEKTVLLRRRGLIDPRAEQLAAAEQRPLVDRDQEGKRIGGHLHEWREALLAKGVTGKHVGGVSRHATRILEAAKINRISELSPSKVQVVLRSLREDGLSLQTLNHHVRAIKQFSRWLWRDGRAREDVLAHLTTFNVKLDPRRQRRALSRGEFARLLEAAQQGPKVLGMSGPERAVLYSLAVGTGFRANELRSLTPESFDLDADPPTVTVQAGYSKRRQLDVQPIRADLADLLRPWLATKLAGVRAFHMPDKTAAMLRSDLEAAGIPFKDESGRVADFHAMRHTAGTLLTQAGVHPKLVQAFMRHSTITLTMDRYTHVGLRDHGDVLDALPAVEVPAEPEVRRATGTENAAATNGARGTQERR